MNTRILPCLLIAAALAPPAHAATPIADNVPCVIADLQDSQPPDRFHFSGWMSTRIEANERGRLVKIDPERLLEGYRQRPGRQAWDGEHVGKWLHAATLAWVYTGDPALRQKLDYVAAELVKCQLPDGYLGTYQDKDRWTEWDVWAHKYNLIGLITYMRHTGNRDPLPACLRMGDLLCKTFGDEPGKRDIIKAGHHVGMAPTSVLEPMVLLFRFTGEKRYLDFCEYILRAWEHPNGPKIVSTLLTAKRVDKVGNGKAYEMLSCLNGLLEYYRTVGGDRKRLEACLNAWQDIVDQRLYVTGAASYGELFHDDFDLPNVANVGETCVTVTWLQFNAQLLRLTGEARFAEQIEHVVLNQLFGAQRPDGGAWGYYVQMEGKKPYSDTLDGHCCLSSGPRGIALIPTFAASTDADGLVVNLYEAGTAELKLRDGTSVSLATDTLYPASDLVTITVKPAARKSFAIKLRIPAWCQGASIQVNGRSAGTKSGADGYVALRRDWVSGDKIALNLPLQPGVIIGDHKNAGKAAITYGPLVLAADEALLTGAGGNVTLVGLPGTELAALSVTPEPAPDALRTWPGSQTFRINAIARRPVESVKAGAPLEVRLRPFADAGATGLPYKIWLPVGTQASGGSLLTDGKESRSRPGNVSGSINDDDSGSFVVTFDGKSAAEDWFAVTMEQPVTLARVVFTHGKTFHDGGWFDTSSGKPRVQTRVAKDGSWETVGELKDYPSTSASSATGLQDGERFSCVFPAQRKAYGVRVIGKPACGDSPQQAFSSCRELQAFEK